jgi:NTP pyrophosphatase (non-canonical NTP hydrolase)
MTANDYQEGCLLTAKPIYHQPTEAPYTGLAIAMLGLAGEAGEVADEFKKVLEGKKELNKLALLLELGDVLWYAAIIAHSLDTPLSEVMQMNLNKLEARHLVGTVLADRLKLTTDIKKEDYSERDE